MSAQKRYTTLLKNTTSIYAAATEKRTELLHSGLTEIVAGISPNGPADWAKVYSDSAMLLSVWTTKEENGDTPYVIRNQLLAFLEAQAHAPMAVPSLHISDPPTDKILHIKEYPSDDEEEEEEQEEEQEQVKIVVVKAAPAPVVDCLQQQTSPMGTSEEVEEEVEEEEEEVEVEVEVEVEEEVEEEVEVEVEEEEEDDLEVEPYVYRGRKYWRDSSGQVYENLAGDEVGDHIGDIVNDKLQFL